MIDRLFTAALTFCLLVGGTLAIGSAMLGTDQRVAAPKGAAALTRIVVQLPPVVVTTRRLAPATDVARRGTEPDDAAAPRAE